jgi:hypothetical protein
VAAAGLENFVPGGVADLLGNIEVRVTKMNGSCRALFARLSLLGDLVFYIDVFYVAVVGLRNKYHVSLKTLESIRHEHLSSAFNNEAWLVYSHSI